MLKLSTRGRYGLRAMTEIARGYGGERPVMMSAITERQQISRKYLHAILTSLKDAGLVRAIRGARGGFVVARPPSDITVGEICEALEGKLAVVDCVADRSVCTRVDTCRTRGMWKRLNDAMVEVLGGTTLADLAENPQVGEGLGLKDCLAGAPR